MVTDQTRMVTDQTRMVTDQTRMVTMKPAGSRLLRGPMAEAEISLSASPLAVH